MFESKRKASQYAYSLILENKFCFAQLDEDDKELLCGYLLDNIPIIHAFEYISDADNKTELPYMLAKYLQTRNPSLGQDILNFLCKNASNMMSNKIDELLGKEKELYELDRKINGDYNE